MLLKLSSIFVLFFSLPIITMYFWRTGKYLKLGGHRRCLGVCPICPPPWQLFSAGAETYYFKFRGGILTGGAYAPPVLKQGVHMHTMLHGCAPSAFCINHCYLPRFLHKPLFFYCGFCINHYSFTKLFT